MNLTEVIRTPARLGGRRLAGPILPDTWLTNRVSRLPKSGTRDPGAGTPRSLVIATEFAESIRT
jgi:hypothetical protein